MGNLITISTRRGCNWKATFPLLVSSPFTTRVTQMAYILGWIHAIGEFDGPQAVTLMYFQFTCANRPSPFPAAKIMVTVFTYCKP